MPFFVKLYKTKVGKLQNVNSISFSPAAHDHHLHAPLVAKCFARPLIWTTVVV